VSPEVVRLADWIRARHPDLAEIDPDADLIESRLVDSLGFTEFVILVEKLSGTPVNVDTMDIDDYRSLNRLERRFFAGQAGTA
jgi:acyl carrier protein